MENRAIVARASPTVADGGSVAEARALLALVAESPSTPVVVGDFNDWLWAGSVRRSLGRALPGC